MRHTTLLVGVAAVAALFFAASFTPQASALQTNSTDSLSVSVNISKKTIVDVSPSSLTWGTALDPGADGSRKDIQIENLGSVNITHVWFNNSQPGSMPFGTGDPAQYNSGNWIALSNDSSSGTYVFPDRKDFNRSNRIIYLTGPDGNSPPNHPYGRFRNSSQEYFWSVKCDADGTNTNLCNDTSDELYVGDTPHTDSQTGDADLSDNSANSLVNVGGNDLNWAVANVTVNGLSLCVAVNSDGSETRWYRWNKEAPGASLCDNSEYLVNADTGDAIVPGESAYARTKAYVPYGVPFNSTESAYDGTLWVIANTV